MVSTLILESPSLPSSPSSTRSWLLLALVEAESGERDALRSLFKGSKIDNSASGLKLGDRGEGRGSGIVALKASKSKSRFNPMGECDFEWIIARTDKRLDNVEAGDGKAGDGKGEEGDTVHGETGSVDGDRIFSWHFPSGSGLTNTSAYSRRPNL